MDNQWHSLPYHDTALMQVPKMFPNYPYNSCTVKFICYITSNYNSSDHTFYIKTSVNAQGWVPGGRGTINIKPHDWYSRLNFYDELYSSYGAISPLGATAYVKIVNDGCAKDWRSLPGVCTDTNYSEQGVKIRCYPIYPKNYAKATG